MKNTYLVGFTFHEPEPYKLWKKGLIEDFESSEAIFIKADSEEDALRWCKCVAEKLLRKVNDDDKLNFEELGYNCWIVRDTANSVWKDSLSSFEYTEYGELPDFDKIIARRI